MSSVLLSFCFVILGLPLQGAPTPGVQCNNTDVKLEDGERHYEGWVKVCYNGTWFPVCDRGINNAVARVVCQQLGLSVYDPKVVVQFGGDTRSYSTFLEGVNCVGNETNLLQCEYSSSEPIEQSDCGYYTIAGISCAPPCNESAVRLLRNRVQICHNKVWGYVCADNDAWSNSDANVVCKELGFSPKGGQSSHDNIIPFFPFFLSNANCNGSETHLIDCPHNNDSDIINCLNVATVFCEEMHPCNETGAVRLTHFNMDTWGRLEVCYNGHWNSVCDDRADNAIATVVCRQLKHDGNGCQVYSQNNVVLPNIPILLDEVQCSGNETSLLECFHNGVYNHDCYHDEDIIVECKDTTCVEGTLSLFGGPTIKEGRVQICYNGQWYSVCGDRWSDIEATVVCSTLGYSTELVSVKTSFGPDASSILHRDIQCNGDEVALTKCNATEYDPMECQQAAGVICEAPCLSNNVTDCNAYECSTPEDCHPISNSSCYCNPECYITGECCPDMDYLCFDDCVDGDVRLQDGTHPSNGRVEICQYGIWGSVCRNSWDKNDAVVVCRQLGYSSEDVAVTDVFGPGRYALSSYVECTGAEENLNLCRISGHICDRKNISAGVFCTNDFDDSRKCAVEAGTPTANLSKITNMERFGVCEPYSGDVEICNDTFAVGTSYVFVARIHGSQKNISKFLDHDLLTTLVLHSSGSSTNCHDQIFTIICNYYLSPCGTESSQVPPYSICPEDCHTVRMKCPEAWEAAQLGLKDYQFINCNDTSTFLFPLVSCCTRVGLQHSMPEEGSKSSVNVGGRVVGTVLGSLILVGAIIVMMVSVYLFFKWKIKQRVKHFQMDILAIPGNRTNAHYTESVARNDGDPAPGISNHFIKTESLNPYGLSSLDDSGVHVPHKPRMNSCYLRELSCGKFIIKCEQLTQLENVGQGEFGIVYRGRYVPQGSFSQEVAIKTVKGHFDQLEFNKFVEESLKMSRFKHAHVMGLIGVCLDAGPAPYIVMPYMANGSLLHYLKKERANLVLTGNGDEDDHDVLEVRKRLMVMCSQIASGMEYLAKEKYVHRDLAARNCMINSHFLIKITDFGLSEDVFLRNYFREGSDGEMVKLPVKWMAPESLSDGHFSEKSDVWSYGVTMWEIFSGGKAPYPGTDPSTLIQKLEEGDRMPKPINAACTEEIYTMMRKCWEMKLENRPSFMELYKSTSKYIEHIAGYLELGYNPFAGMKKNNSTTELKDNQMKEEDVEAELTISK